MHRRTATVALLLALLSSCGVLLVEQREPTPVRSLPRTEHQAGLTRPQPVGTSTLTVEQVTSATSLALSPGEPRELTVRVGNPVGADPVLLSALRVTWDDANPACDRSNLRVEQYDATTADRRYRIAPGAQELVVLQIELINKPVNQDACRRVTFPLAFEAVGTAA